MSLAVFDRSTARILDRLGLDALLRGETAGKVNVEHGVQLSGQYEDATLIRDVATILKKYVPKVGDVLVHPDGTYKLDVLLEDNGSTRRFAILPTTGL